MFLGHGAAMACMPRLARLGRFVVRPRGLGPAHKPHKQLTILCDLQYLSTVCGAPARARLGPQITHKVIEKLLCTILCLGLRCARAGRARPTSHTTSQRSVCIYNTSLRLAVRPRVPGLAQKSHNKSTLSKYLLYVLSVRGAPARAGPVGPPPPHRPGTRTHKQGIDRLSIGYRLKYHVS